MWIWVLHNNLFKSKDLLPPIKQNYIDYYYLLYSFLLKINYYIIIINIMWMTSKGWKRITWLKYCM